MATRYDDYEPQSYGRHNIDEEDRDYRADLDRRDRSFTSRVGDEVRSWFGDEEAERRRRLDEQYGSPRRRDSSASTPSGLNMRAHQVMTVDPVLVRPSDPIEKAAHYMRKYDCGAIPVIDNYGRLIGMITDRDITIRVFARGIDARGAFVSDCMTGEAFACGLDDSIQSCMRAMSRHQVRRIPILDDRDRVVGIVSQSDLARHAGRHAYSGERRALAKVLCAISEPTHIAYR